MAENLKNLLARLKDADAAVSQLKAKLKDDDSKVKIAEKLVSLLGEYLNNDMPLSDLKLSAKGDHLSITFKVPYAGFVPNGASDLDV